MNTLKHYGGNGYYGLAEHGKYLIKHENKEVEFSSLTEAKEYYSNLNEEKAFWDMSRTPELIDCHTL